MKSTRLLLALLLLAQFCLFWQFANREIVWAYPNGYDQTSYLAASYTLAQEEQRDGPLPAVGHYLRQQRPTGFMLPLQWNLFQFFAGPGRLSALTLDFCYLVALEIVFWLTARHLTGRTAGGWIAVGLLLAQQSAFLGNGGMFDCRIDFIVYNLYGVFVCCLVCSNGLRDKRWLGAALGCAVLLMTFRFITVTYFIGLFCTLFTLLLGWRLVRRGRRRETLVLRLAMWRVAALGVIVAVAGGLLIAANWKVIHDYYVVGHLTGNEKSVRAAEMGVKNLSGHLLYYFDSLWRMHLGPTFLVLGLGVLVSAAVFGWRGRRAEASAPADPVQGTRWVVNLFILCASLFAPWFILTLDESKSPVVADVLAPPAALLLILLAARMGPAAVRAWRVVPAESVWRRRGWQAVAVAVVSAGFLNWLNELVRQGPFSPRRASVEQINALYDCIAAGSARLGLAAPRLGTDLIAEWNVPNAVNVSVWERRGQWPAVRAGFGYDIMEQVVRERVFNELEAVDVMLVSTLPKVGPYPVINSIRPLEKEVAAWCAAHLLPIHTFEIEGGEVTVYMRPGVRYAGLSGEWVTPAGFRVEVPAETLAAMRAAGRHVLVLEGPENPYLSKAMPVASAHLVGNGDPACPASFTMPRAGAYEIRLDLGGPLAAVPAGADAVVAVGLDGASFVPLDVGINDTRRLVVTQPTGIRFE